MTPDLVKALAELITSLAWPLIVVLIIVTQRKPFAALLANLESLTLPGGIEAKIRKQVEKETAAILREEPKGSEAPSARQLEAAERIQRFASGADLSTVRRQVEELAKEYERIRATMPSGDERTRRMEVVATKMRTLGLAAEALLDELTRSGSAGMRLAATQILQVGPRPEYLDWLAERLGVEKPFIGYHAAVALEVAARVLDPGKRDLLNEAIYKAQQFLGPGGRDSDRDRLLKRTEAALAEIQHN